MKDLENERDLERAKVGVRVGRELLDEAEVDHVDDVRHRDRTLGNVGCQDNLAVIFRRFAKYAILFFACDSRMQW